MEKINSSHKDSKGTKGHEEELEGLLRHDTFVPLCVLRGFVAGFSIRRHSQFDDALDDLAGLLVAQDLLELVAVHALFLDERHAVDAVPAPTDARWLAVPPASRRVRPAPSAWMSADL